MPRTRKRLRGGARTCAVRTVVIFESLTGNTRHTAEHIGAELRAAGGEATVCAIDAVDLTALSKADLVVVGSWVDGLFFVAQKPGRSGRLRGMPVIDGKKAAVFCTYAVDPGKTLSKLSQIVEDRGGDVIGGVAIRRNALEDGARDFVDRLLGVLEPAG